mgnify:CR=1 FL=1
MSPRPRTQADSIDTERTRLPRRRFLALGAGVGVSLLAGCSGTDGSGPETGEFRLLISDQPADIGDFDRLDVTIDSARIFEGGQETTETNGTATQEPDGTIEETETTTAEPTTESEDTEQVADRVRKGDGFYILDLENVTVDLTQVLGADAMGVFEGELETGTYAKIELNVSDVEGIVENEEVAVKVPSEKLQITQPFEVTAEEPVEFVFDINVVKKGPHNGYNLLPVISESGVAGESVEMTEVPRTTNQSA